jgi:hypothetical protein
LSVESDPTRSRLRLPGAFPLPPDPACECRILRASEDQGFAALAPAAFPQVCPALSAYCFACCICVIVKSRAGLPAVRHYPPESGPAIRPHPSVTPSRPLGSLTTYIKRPHVGNMSKHDACDKQNREMDLDMIAPSMRSGSVVSATSTRKGSTMLRIPTCCTNSWKLVHSPSNVHITGTRPVSCLLPRAFLWRYFLYSASHLTGSKGFSVVVSIKSTPGAPERRGSDAAVMTGCGVSVDVYKEEQC